MLVFIGIVRNSLSKSLSKFPGNPLCWNLVFRKISEIHVSILFTFDNIKNIYADLLECCDDKDNVYYAKYNTHMY